MRSWIPVLGLLLLAACGAPSSGPSTGGVTLAGLVMDVESGQPLQGVSVMARSTDGAVLGQAHTSGGGRFTIFLSAAVPVVLEIIEPGFQPYRIRMGVPDPMTELRPIQLRRAGPLQE